ncbi:MAG: GDSL-type esterase/lipase family protein [Nitrospirae bacterium]|nr:GDSL-type esterase/lipase family protein [Nitrospirota bacterium]MDA1305219.1 GDSL-type esterase/lipase family protein [Nitrospirota bacterium]
MKSKAPFLVCLGDSLTAGYQIGAGGVNIDMPPGGFIQQWAGTQAEILVTGICGEVTLEMVNRFSRDVVAHAPEITVILGGTNDLGCGEDLQQICQNLEHMYRVALDAGIQPVGVTVPSIYLGYDEWGLTPKEKSRSDRPLPGWVQAHIDRRLVLNQKIVEVCQALNMKCLDLFGETSEGPYQLLASRLSSDGLHFNSAGYEVFARLVWRHLLTEPFGACPPSK